METEEKLLAKVKKIANKNGYVSIGEINKIFNNPNNDE